MTILELFAEHVQKKPEQIAVIYKSETKITNKKLWELSGKIYAWLNCLPRGVELYACIIGTIRIGAAFVLTETDNNPKRTEFIKQDCKCKLFVDEDCWKEIINTDSLDGYEPVNLHNLCYIAYTSGKTRKGLCTNTVLWKMLGNQHDITANLYFLMMIHF